MAVTYKVGALIVMVAAVFVGPWPWGSSLGRRERELAALDVDYELRNLLSPGGSIDPMITSPRESMPQKGLLMSFIFPGRSPGVLPDKVMEAAGEYLECWAFNGSQGFIGFHLREISQIHSFIFDHADPTLSSLGYYQTAPREFILWALMDVKHAVTKGNPTMFPLPEILDPTMLGHNPQYLYSWRAAALLNGTYDARNLKTMQEFRVEDENPASQLSVGNVLLQINSNWGSTDRTCLYHVKVIGRVVSLGLAARLTD